MSIPFNWTEPYTICPYQSGCCTPTTTTTVAIVNVPHCCVELAGACLVAMAHGMVLQHFFCCSWYCPCVPWWLWADESWLSKVVVAGGGGEVRLALLMLALLMLAWSWEMVPL